MKTNIPFLSSFLVASLLMPAALAKEPQDSPLPNDKPQNKVQIALLLDTSNSMDGLIDQAKTQLWKVVNTFAEAKRDGQTPFVEVALYEYGNNGLNIANNWIRLVEPLTRDLDEVSKELFAFRTNGGDEYCGAVIQRALADLSWDSSPKTYKAIFIAGNEPFLQGPVDARQACRDAMSKGIVVNTIHCGSREAGIAGAWHDGAALAEGKYLIIDQDKAVAHVDAPQDKEISSLSIEINKTYLGYGALCREGMAKQVEADRDATANARQGAAVGRAATKASSNYYNGSWDLVDACKDGRMKLEDVPADQLPDAMKAMSPAEREAHLAKMTAERAGLQKKIQELTHQREAFVVEEMKRQAAATGVVTLDQAIVDTARNQAAVRGYSFQTP
ncbi:vWA domain-containing protein [Luteolibacter luteus]|uniref:VWA domain-containing protein n=1 Tax=Luteolibacter luteus TaxID=2728835 RepID=A0A858RL31_9BACT|nr:vWA domain-containing protein [Luteolibacter luteus]QJE97204.1 VWA domain-containing protein [Luteolibacter luteus]